MVDTSKECNEILCPYASVHWRWRDGARLYKPERVMGPTAMPMKLKRGKTQHEKSVRALVLERDGHKCLRCGSASKLTYDHVVPVSKGGGRTLENGQTLCSDCNGWKKDRTIDFRK